MLVGIVNREIIMTFYPARFDSGRFDSSKFDVLVEPTPAVEAADVPTSITVTQSELNVSTLSDSEG